MAATVAFGLHKCPQMNVYLMLLPLLAFTPKYALGAEETLKLGICEFLTAGSLLTPPPAEFVAQVQKLDAELRLLNEQNAKQTKTTAEAKAKGDKAYDNSGFFDFMFNRERRNAYLATQEDHQRAVDAGNRLTESAAEKEKQIHTALADWLKSNQEDYRKLSAIKALFSNIGAGVAQAITAFKIAKEAVDDASGSRSWDMWVSSEPNKDGSKSFGQQQKERADQKTLYATQTVVGAQTALLNLNMQMPMLLAQLQKLIFELGNHDQAKAALALSAEMIAPQAVNVVAAPDTWLFLAGSDNFFYESSQVNALNSGSEQLAKTINALNDLRGRINQRERAIDEELKAFLCAYRGMCTRTGK